MRKNNKKKMIDLIIILACSILSLILWETKIIYPIKLFVVLLHEMGHTIMAFITGGSVYQIIISNNLSGTTLIKGGNPIITASAGYLGSLVFGSLLLLSVKYIRLRKWFIPILSLLITIISINLIQDGMIIFFSLAISVLLFLSIKYLNEIGKKIVLMFFGLTSCFYIISDIKQDLLTISLRETDTQILEYLSGIPAILIGTIWFLISILIVTLILKQIIIQKD